MKSAPSRVDGGELDKLSACSYPRTGVSSEADVCAFVAGAEVPDLQEHLHGVGGRDTLGKRTVQISNHFSTLWTSWFFLRFCLSSAAH